MGVRIFFRWLTIGAALVGCPGPSPLPPSTVSLRVRGTPADATVIVDDQVLGSLEYVAARGVALPPGVHHVTVQSPGFFPADREVEAKLTERPAPIDVVVQLVPVPD
jgi:hypothetical protein